ncbi:MULTISPECIES: hypothetical protein [unclassified Burkholderia]|uniref:hypothetical protein n=1 Tax=unclassified Burkholderia TaxID=2613784 RepID=UPI001E3ED8A3|nr:MULTISPECIES: hypothetical protein [unclassified Burkholderia]UEP32468.1 hypothetical protein LMA01_34070 [Burkholderia sp. B21-007]UEP46474.1 hypothetical protein LMA02_32205 [Burkholderia sp. B21-005]
MKRINLSAALRACADDVVRQKLAQQVGLPPHAIEQVFASSAAILIAALAARAAEGRDETIAVFGALMSRTINPRIRDECATWVESTGKLKELEHAGFTLVAHATGIDATELSDHVAPRVAVPAQATCALTCVCAAIVGGLIKHHMLIEQADVSDLPGLFAGQLATIAEHLNDDSIDVLGYLHADVNAFLDQVSTRLTSVTADFEPVRPRIGEGTTVIDAPVRSQPQSQPQPPIPAHNRYEIGKVFVNDIRFTSAMQPSQMGPVGSAAKRGKPTSRRTWKVFALTTATVLVAVLAWGKVFHWPDMQSALAQVTRPAAKSISVVSGAISSPDLKTASVK